MRVINVRSNYFLPLDLLAKVKGEKIRNENFATGPYLICIQNKKFFA